MNYWFRLEILHYMQVNVMNENFEGIFGRLQTFGNKFSALPRSVSHISFIYYSAVFKPSKYPNQANAMNGNKKYHFSAGRNS